MLLHHPPSMDLSSAIITHTLQSLEHHDRIAADDYHAQPLTLAAGLFLDRVVEHNVEEDL